MLSEARIRPIPDEYRYLRGLPEEVYDKSDSSHIVQIIKTICGESGVKSIRKFMFMERLHSSLEETEFSDLDVLFGGLLRLPRLSSEQYPYNPLTDLLTDDEWAEVRSSDASYRKRIWMYLQAIANGGTVEGIRYAAQAAIGEPCHVFEPFRRHLAFGYADGDTLPSTAPVSIKSSAFSSRHDVSASWGSGSDYSTSSDTLTFGATKKGVGLRFDIPISSDETVIEARLVLTSRSTTSSEVLAEISVVETSEGHPIVPPGVDFPESDGSEFIGLWGFREYTTMVDWAVPPVLAGQELVSPDISGMIQFAVDSGAWDDYPHVLLFVDDYAGRNAVGRSVSVHSFDSNPSLAPVLLLVVERDVGYKNVTRFDSARYGEVVVVPSSTPATESERQLWKRQIHLSTSRVKPQDSVITTLFRSDIIDTELVDDSVVVPSLVESSSDMSHVRRLVTGRSDWPVSVDNKRGFWVVADERVEAPTPASGITQESVIDANSSILSIEASSSHIGAYNDTHTLVYPYLRAFTSTSESVPDFALRNWSKKSFYVNPYTGRTYRRASLYE